MDLTKHCFTNDMGNVPVCQLTGGHLFNSHADMSFQIKTRKGVKQKEKEDDNLLASSSYRTCTIIIDVILIVLLCFSHLL